MFCQSCGTEIGGGATSCPKCNKAAAASGAAAAIWAKLREAGGHSFKALKQLAQNPIGGLAQANDDLQEPLRWRVGLIYAFVAAVAAVVCAYSSLPAWLRPNGIGPFFKIFSCGLVPFVGLIAGMAACRKMFGGQSCLSSETFVAGASMLPLACFLLVFAILGTGSVEVLGLAAITALSWTVLMVYAGSTRVSKLSDRAAALAVPLTLFLSMWLNKIVYTSLLKQYFP